MSKKHDYIDAKRRGFIQSSILATGAVAAGTASVEATADALTKTPLESEVETKRHQGYQETEQVLKYYSKARF